MNLAAMLDMAFQLLTFFILTFRVSPIEGQLALQLPPPEQKAPTNVDAGGVQKDPILDMPLNLETIHLQVTADPTGEVGEVSIEKSATFPGPMNPSNLQLLERKLQSIFALQSIPFDRVQIAVDGQLRYGELMKVIDVCSRQKRPNGELINKISFTVSK